MPGSPWLMAGFVCGKLVSKFQKRRYLVRGTSGARLSSHEAGRVAPTSLLATNGICSHTCQARDKQKGRAERDSLLLHPSSNLLDTAQDGRLLADRAGQVPRQETKG